MHCKNLLEKFVANLSIKFDILLSEIITTFKDV